MADVNQNLETQGANPTAGTEQARTFTQAELDAIVGERLARERAKYADYETMKEKAGKYDAAEEASKSELQKATEKVAALQAQVDKMVSADKVRQVREKVAKDMKVPASLLSADTEEACKAQAQAILDFAKPAGYPEVKNGGEKPHAASSSARDQFANWFNSTVNS